MYIIVCGGKAVSLNNRFTDFWNKPILKLKIPYLCFRAGLLFDIPKESGHIKNGLTLERASFVSSIKRGQTESLSIITSCNTYFKRE